MKEKTAIISAILFLTITISLFIGNKCLSANLPVKTKQPIKVHVRKLSETEIYVINVQNKIKANWHPPKNKKIETNVVVLFKLDRHGNILSTKVLKSSNDVEIDNSAVKAVQKSSPLPQLPKEIKDSSVDMQLNFDYNTTKNAPKF